MPATAGRVRMPANNRVHSSAALQTHGIWQSAIGYDPYAPSTDTRNKSKPESDNSAANAYNSFQDLLALARVTSASDPAGTRGACKKCGRIGHLTYQCRNFLSLKNSDDDDVIKPPRQQNYDPAAHIEKIEESAGDDDESLSSDSDSDSSIDPEIEKIIAERFGKKMSTKVGSLSERSGKRSNSSDDDDDEEEKRKERKHGHGRRSHHRRHRRRRDSDSDSDSNSVRKHRRKRRKDSDSDSDSDKDRKHRRRRRRRRRRRERRSVLSSGSESTGSSSEEEDGKRRVKKEKKRSRR